MTYWWSSVTFTLSILFMGNMIYFMLLHQRIDEELGHKTRCVAKHGINHPINVTGDTDMDYVVDVGKMFYMIFFVGVFTNLVNALYSLCACFTFQTWKSCHQAVLVILYVATLGYLVGVTYLRYDHGGRVCSGDFLFRPISQATREAGILGVEGQFLEVFIICGWVQQAVLVTIFLANACCAGPKNEDRERDM